jgi:hypothetical protein
MVKRNRINGETIIYKILHSKLEIERHEPHYKPGVNTCNPEGWALAARLMGHYPCVQCGHERGKEDGIVTTRNSTHPSESVTDSS